MLNKIIKRVIKIFILSLLCFSSFSYAANDEIGDPRGVIKNFFAEPFETVEPNGECKVRCRAVNPNYAETYITKIVDYDATTGVTSCDIFPKNSEHDSSTKMDIMANHKDTNCQKLYDDIIPNYSDPSLASIQYMKANESNKLKVTVGEEYDRSKITLSKMLGGVASMDQDIVDLKATVDTGTFTRTDGASQDTYLMNSQKPEDVNTANDNQSSGQSGNSSQSSDRLYDISDKISKENLGYYADLIYYLDKLRDYTATYLLVILSLIAFLWLFSNFIIKKISKKPTTYDTPWAWRVFTVVIAISIFFLGIKKDDNYSSTLFLGISQFAIDESNSIADRLNMIGMKVLMQHQFNKTGASGVEAEANLKTLKAKQEHLKYEYNRLLEQCADRFQYSTTFQETDPNIIARIEILKGKDGSYTDLIYRGCRAVEKRYKVALTSEEQLNYMLSRIQTAYQENTVVQKLKEIDKYMASAVVNFGWLSSAIASTVDVLIQISYMQENSKTPPPVHINEQNQQDQMFEAKINEANEVKVAKHEGDQAGGNELTNQLISNPDFQGKIGKIFGNFTQSLNPLYKNLSDFITNGLASPEVLQIMGMTPNEKGELDIKDQTNLKIASQGLTTIILNRMNDIAPSAFAFIAAAVLIIMYYFKLIVFLFISPFAMLLSLTTGENKKIFDFLVHGIVLFLTPAVITLSVYFAQFLGQQFDDVFMSMLDEQIRLSLISSYSFWGVLSLTTVLGFAKVFAVFAKCIIIYRIIMNMPQLVFKMVGLDRGDGTSAIADSMHNKMTKHLK